MPQRGRKINLQPTLIFCDNQAAVMLSDTNASSKRMKHVITRLSYLRELVNDKKICLYHVGTKGQIADLFTKPLAAKDFHRLREVVLN